MKSKNQLLDSAIRIFILALLLVTTTSTHLMSQDRLVPGRHLSFLKEYDLALSNLFEKAYYKDVLLWVEITSKYGIETLTGIREYENQYELFHLVPEHGLWNSLLIEVPCEDISLVNSSCYGHDFTSVDTIKVKELRKPIKETLATNLYVIWEEMIFESRYPREPKTLFGGTQFQYSVFVSGHGNLEAYSSNPAQETLSGRLAEISILMKEIATNNNDELHHKLYELSIQTIQELGVIIKQP